MPYYFPDRARGADVDAGEGGAGEVGVVIDVAVDIDAGLAVCAMDIVLIFITAEPPPPSSAYG
jgi:hypothetical protein